MKVMNTIMRKTKKKKFEIVERSWRKCIVLQHYINRINDDVHNILLPNLTTQSRSYSLSRTTAY